MHSPVLKHKCTQPTHICTHVHTFPHIFPFLSYDVMKSCWRESPRKRPSFAELVETLTAILKPLADYMDFSTLYCKKVDTEEDADADDDIIETSL